MALTSTTHSRSNTPTQPVTTAHDQTPLVRAYPTWIAALAVWFWREYEVTVSGRHLVAVGVGVGALLGVLFASTLLLAMNR